MLHIGSLRLMKLLRDRRLNKLRNTREIALFSCSVENEEELRFFLSRVQSKKEKYFEDSRW
uniref:Uncharacterized protein n=1 Tax=Romanomermis culicivorax TaxID=13658 RepID=A0A915JRS9_ROMCU